MRNQWGVNNPNWKGSNIGYAMLHKRVEKLRGKPKICHQCGTTERKHYEWANLTGNYSNPEDYRRMCKPCHSKFDLRGKINHNARKTHCIHGHPFNVENTYITPVGKRSCRICNRISVERYQEKCF